MRCTQDAAKDVLTSTMKANGNVSTTGEILPVDAISSSPRTSIMTKPLSSLEVFSKSFIIFFNFSLPICTMGGKLEGSKPLPISRIGAG